MYIIYLYLYNVGFGIRAEIGEKSRDQRLESLSEVRADWRANG